MKKVLAIMAILSGIMKVKPEAPKMTEPARPKNPTVPKGAKVFSFPDGFSCIAINEANAQRKWARHLEAKAVTA